MKKLLITLLAVNCTGNLWSMEEDDKRIEFTFKNDKSYFMPWDAVKKIPLLFELSNKNWTSDPIFLSEYSSKTLELVQAIIEGQDPRFFVNIKQYKDDEEKNVQFQFGGTEQSKTEALKYQMNQLSATVSDMVKETELLKKPIKLQKFNPTFNDCLLLTQFIVQSFNEPQTDLLASDIISNHLFQSKVYENIGNNEVKKIFSIGLKRYHDKIRRAFAMQYPEYLNKKFTSKKADLLFSTKINGDLKQVLLINQTPPKIVVQDGKSVYVLSKSEDKKNPVHKCVLKIPDNSICGKFFSNETLDRVFFSVFPDREDFAYSGLVYFDLNNIQGKNIIEPLILDGKSISTQNIKKGIVMRDNNNTILGDLKEIPNDSFFKQISIPIGATKSFLIGRDQKGYILLKRDASILYATDEQTVFYSKENDSIDMEGVSYRIAQGQSQYQSFCENNFFGWTFQGIGSTSVDLTVLGQLNTGSKVDYFSLKNFGIYKKLKNDKYIIRDSNKNLICAAVVINNKETSYNDGVMLLKNNSLDKEPLEFCDATDDGSLVIAQTSSYLYYFIYDAKKNNYSTVVKTKNDKEKVEYFLGENNGYVVEYKPQYNRIELFDIMLSIDEIVSTIIQKSANLSSNKPSKTANENQQPKEQKVQNTQPSWWIRQVSWLKSYIKPILVTASVVGVGTLLYKIRQARMKKKVEEEPQR